MAKWLNQVGDVQAKQADEESLLVARFERFAFVEEVANGETALAV